MKDYSVYSFAWGPIQSSSSVHSPVVGPTSYAASLEANFNWRRERVGGLKEIVLPLTCTHRTPSGGLRAETLHTLSSQAPLSPRGPSAPALSPKIE